MISMPYVAAVAARAAGSGAGSHAGMAVSVLASSDESFLRPAGVRFIPLHGVTVDLILVWAPGPESPPAALA